ncbi:MAG: sulfite exporter TauE/SafE family protein [Actinomycetales bacterium]
MNLVIAAIAGLVIGLSLGALGGGGSILTVPVLIYLLGQDPQAATTGSLVVVGVSALTGAISHARAGRVRWGQGLLFGVVGTGGTWLGAKAAAGVPAQVLLGAFSLLLIAVSVVMFLRSRAGRSPGAEGEEHPILTWTPSFVCDCPRALKVLVTGTGVGLLTGFFGVGGGFVVVPALSLALGFSMPVAVGTSLLVIVVNSLTALAARLSHGVEIDWAVIAMITVVAMAGSVLGTRVASKVPARMLTRAFAVLLALVAGYMAISTLPALLS